MGKIVPGVAVGAVVLADRAPLPLAEIRSPFLPRDLRLACLVQPPLFSDVHDRRIHVRASSRSMALGSIALRGPAAGDLSRLPPPGDDRRRCRGGVEVGNDELVAGQLVAAQLIRRDPHYL